MSKHVLSWLTVLFILAGMLAGCVAPAAAPTPVPAAQAPEPTAVPPTAVPEPTKAPEPTAVPPTAAPEPTKAPEPTQAAEAPKAHDPARLILATTTSTADSGLLDFILPDFEKLTGSKVDVIAVGSGQAIEIGTKGDADVLLVHSRKAEDKFVADGDAKERLDVMYNDFIIVGPKEDPAKITGMSASKDAFKAIMDASAPFASRGDKSGTNTKELSVWSSAAITPTKEMPWYNSLGQGMGDTLLFSNEKGAYTLADRGTYLSMQEKLPNLTILVGGQNLAENKDKALLNPYGVLAVNPEKHPNVNADLASKFVEWIIAADTQKIIGGYGADKFGQPLFYPSSKEYKATLPPAVALKVTGKVGKEQGWSEADVKALKTMDVQYTNSKGVTATYTGVPVSALLALASPAADAKTVEFVASDGFTAEAPLADIQTCKDCIVAFQTDGGFSTVLPNFAKNQQVKSLVEIKLK
jgi:tungstate transport system substrate-binding protein